MKNDPLPPPSLVPIPPRPQRSPIHKLKPLHSDLAIKPRQLVLFSLYSEASEGNPKGNKKSPRHGTTRTCCSLANQSLAATRAEMRVIY